MNQIFNDAPIFENYNLFIHDHHDEIGTPAGVMRLLTDDGMFRAYVDSLIEGLNPVQRNTVIPILNQQRWNELNKQVGLFESANVPASGTVSGWSVAMFPIITSIYAEPIIAELCNVYPVDKPMISIPRIRYKAQTRSFDGSTVSEVYMPTALKMVRAGIIEVNVTPNSSTNIFTAAGLNPAHMKMNRRYTFISKVNITETTGGGTIINRVVIVNFRPDSRSQITGEFSFNDDANNVILCNFNGHINFEKGLVSYQILNDVGTSTSTFVVNSCVFSLKFQPYATMNGRTKVTTEKELTDIVIDPCDDFLIDLTEEEMQDYSTVYQIDLIRSLGEVIKRQISLNKDSELAYFLTAAEPDIEKFGAKSILDFDMYVNRGGAGDYTPSTVVHVLKALVPRINTVMSIIRRNFNMYPSYLLAGLKTSSVIKSLQDMMVNIPGISGEIGFNGSMSQFLKLRTLESFALDENKIYLSTKAPEGSLERSTILDLVFQPMYMIKEITDGNTRTFVRSRTLIEIVRTDGLGLIECKNLEKYVG